LQQNPERPHSSSPAELKERMDAERAGRPFLLFRDDTRAQRIFLLPDSPHVTIGRGPDNDLAVPWDERVSRVHAELVRLGKEWTVVDDGLSRNGSYLNGERVSGRRRLRDGDLLRIGETAIVFRAPAEDGPASTVFASTMPAAADVSAAKRRVLVELARPYHGSTGFATPATNQQIADALFLSVDGVKTHLRGLFELFGVQHLPQNEKRAKLVEHALLAGVITERDLAPREQA
jgi:pSer/pThr/pTyr-binding forkhead associated (FHA) protein